MLQAQLLLQAHLLLLLQVQVASCCCRYNLGQLLLQIQLLLKVQQQMLWQVLLLLLQVLLQVLLLHAQVAGAGICAANLAERETTNPPMPGCPPVAAPLRPPHLSPPRRPARGAWPNALARRLGTRLTAYGLIR